MEEEKQDTENYLPKYTVQEITDMAFKLNSQRKERKKLKERAFVDFNDD